MLPRSCALAIARWRRTLLLALLKLSATRSLSSAATKPALGVLIERVWKAASARSRLLRSRRARRLRPPPDGRARADGAAAAPVLRERRAACGRRKPGSSAPRPRRHCAPLNTKRHG